MSEKVGLVVYSYLRDSRLSSAGLDPAGQAQVLPVVSIPKTNSRKAVASADG